MPICVTNLLNRLSKWPKILPKTAPTAEFFVHSEGSEGVPEVITPSILIRLIQPRAVGVMILSTGLNLAFLRPNMSIVRLQMTVSEEFLVATAASGLLCFSAPEAKDSCLRILILSHASIN